MPDATSTARTSAHSHDVAELILQRCSPIAPGSRLPTERQLAVDLGVTRTTVRHALSLLESEGRISREVGRGTFFREIGARGRGAGHQNGPTGSDEVGPADVMAARRLIEPQVLPLVVAWATTRDFEEMRRCLDGGATADSYEEFELWDFALHHAVVAASRNRLLVGMYSVVEQARRGEIWGNLKRRNDSRERREAYQADHAELVQALGARELSRAVQAMEIHLARVEANLLGAGPQSQRDAPTR
jgi:DNA-binding FadR family transcriptional regulator